MDMLERVLRQVQSGEQRFSPSGKTVDDIQKFQEVAAALVHAGKLGLIRDCKPHVSNRKEGNWYDLVLVIGGITHPGREYLADIDSRSRTIPIVLSDSMYGIPPSGDYELDEMLRVAVSEFREADPKRRENAVHRLWDAWERLITLQDAKDKKRGVAMLIECAADEPNFRELLKVETDWVKEVGGKYQIRHHHTNTIPITRPEQYDYLFPRLLALMHLFLVSRRNG